MRFEYLEADSVERAIALLGKHGDRARVIAGGTDLVPKLRARAVVLDHVIDISYIPDLDYIRYDDTRGLSIGALTPIRALETAVELRRRYSVIAQAAAQLGSIAIRTVGTIGGNLCNAVPSAEMAPPLIALAARARLVGPGGERVVPLEKFFTGVCTTVLAPDEILTEIQVPVPPPGTSATYVKHSIRGTIDLAIVNVAVALSSDGGVCRDIRLVLGAVAPTPMRACHAEALLAGSPLDDGMLRKAAGAAAEESRPITDQRASAAYRRQLVRVYTARMLRTALGRGSA